MQNNSSYRQIIRSTGLIGAASLVNVAIGLARMKAVALLLGPAGIGLVGLYQNLLATASTISGVGISNVGTRQIAEANERGEDGAVGDVRSALFTSALILSGVGVFVFWLLRDIFAIHVLGDREHSSALGWLSLGVGLTVVAGSQLAVLQGLRRTGDIALLSIFSAAISTLLGVGAIYLFGFGGIFLLTLAVPASSCLLGVWYLSKISGARLKKNPRAIMLNQWRSLMTLGAPFMIAGLFATLAQLLVRTVVQKDLGANALGNFQASWQISMTYVGLVLIAMGTDYYPRLTSVIGDKAAATKMANEQTEVALLLAGPVLIAMLALAPWIVRLLYSEEFGPASSVLRLQVIGDLLKVASWPLGYVLLASADGKKYLITEAIAYGSFVIFTAILLPALKLEAAGAAFIMMYAIYLPCVYLLARRKINFAWSLRVKVRFGILLIATAACLMFSAYMPGAGVLISLLIASALACEALNYMHRLGLLKALINKLIPRSR